MAEIIPAILTDDVSDFRKQYSELLAHAHIIKKLHIDFADGSMVGTKTIQPSDLSFLVGSPLTLMAHFMTNTPQNYFGDAKKAGFSYVSIHHESFDDPKELLDTVDYAKMLGFKVGLVINPDTALPAAAAAFKKVDFLQLMGNEPGTQGSIFLTETLDRIRELKALIKDAIIAVDGGIKVGTAKECVKAGADWLVVGSAIATANDEENVIHALQRDINI